MGKKKKLEKFAEVSAFENVFEHQEAPKGKWDSAFDKKRPLTLELGCGKGEYTLGLAKMYPDRNFVGLDIKGNRIWRGAKTALAEGLQNVAFLRCQINLIAEYFESGEVDSVWITFPDPQPRDGKAKKRLTHPLYLERYRQISGKSIDIHLKTDSPLFYEFTLEVIKDEKLELVVANDDIYNWNERPEELNIRTFYEDIWQKQGISSKYIHFKI
jgi:tRNA (guanine-N7-)-methyltransferase